MQKDIEKVSNASYGLSGILQTWMNKKVQRTESLLVNLYTLCRNIHSEFPDISQNEFVEHLKFDIQLLLLYYSELCANSAVNINDAYVVIYIPSYHTFPKTHLRKESPNNHKLADKFKKIVAAVCPKEDGTFNFNGMTGYYLYCGKRKLPHLELAEYLDIKNSKSAVNRSRAYGLISHYAIDYHVFAHMRNTGYVIDSFTGNYYPTNLLGKKVFKEITIPFNSVTHMLLGDKTLIRCQLNIRDKKNVIELSVKNNWTIRTKHQILKDIEHILPEQLLTTVKL